MKILWLSHLVPYPPKGGVLQRSFNLLKEMSRYHEITLVAFNQSKFLESSLPGVLDPLEVAKSELSQFVYVAEIFDVPENTLPLGRYLIALKALVSGRAFNMTWLDSKDVHDAIERLVSEQEFDAVHMDTISLGVYSEHFNSIPIVLNHHNFESNMLKSRAANERNFFKRLYYGLEAHRLLKSELHYCKFVSLNLACSDDDAGKMTEDTGANNFITVPNGVDVSYFFPNDEIEVNDKNIVIVGGLSWYPNREAVEYFINDIWPMLNKEIPGLQVDIIGRNPTKYIVETSERDESIKVHGFVDDVRHYLWRSQIYLCPVKTGGGTKLKILDALAAGCCIVAHPFSCKGISVINGRHVFFAETPAEYVSKIRYLIENPDVRDRVRQEAPRLIKDVYNYESIGKYYSRELVSLLNEESQGGKGACPDQ